MLYCFRVHVVRQRTACVASTHFVPRISYLIWHTSDGLHAIEMSPYIYIYPYTVRALRTPRSIIRTRHVYIKDRGTQHWHSINKYT